MIKPRRTGAFLPRPFSVAGWKARKQKAPAKNQGQRGVDGGGTLRFLVAMKGRGSRELAAMRPGEEAELTGPLGNTWPLELIPRGPVALIAGGIGIAPLLALASELEKKPNASVHEPDGFVFDFYAGFKSGAFGQKLKARNLIIATEDGSQGLKGRITEFFNPTGYKVVFACGPEPMLKTVVDICFDARVPCFMSVEKHIACGVGACLGCTVKTTGGNRRCCVDGPVFNAEELCFES